MQIGADGGTLTVNIINHPEAPAPSAPVSVDRRRRRKVGGVDMRRRRQMTQAAQVDTHKAELQRAYESRKASGTSYRKAYAELGGAAEDTRAWWRAAPDPKAVRP
jgi:hypothetical protein